MHAAALFALGNQLFGFRHRKRLALAGFVEHIADVAHEEADALVQISAAFAHHDADAAALAGRGADVAFIGLQEPADALVVNLLRAGGDGALDRNDAHNACAHRGVRGMLNLAGGGMLMECRGDFRMCFKEILIQHHELKDAGRIRRQQINLQVDLRDHDLYNGKARQPPQNLSGLLDRHFGLARDDGHKAWLHVGHGVHDLNLLIGEPVQRLVLRAVRRDGIVACVDLLT